MNFLKLIKLEKFKKNLENESFSKKYLNSKIHELDCLDWLIEYYKNPGILTPKKYLELLLDNNSAVNKTWKEKYIFVLYHWIFNNDIRGF